MAWTGNARWKEAEEVLDSYGLQNFGGDHPFRSGRWRSSTLSLKTNGKGIESLMTTTKMANRQQWIVQFFLCLLMKKGFALQFFFLCVEG